MNTEQRSKLSSLITQRLIEALEAENPSAAMVDKAIAWLTRVDSGAVKQPELAKERDEELREKLKRLPFPTAPKQPVWDRSLGLPHESPAQE
jgi:hypothetical protein